MLLCSAPSLLVSACVSVGAEKLMRIERLMGLWTTNVAAGCCFNVLILWMGWMRGSGWQENLTRSHRQRLHHLAGQKGRGAEAEKRGCDVHDRQTYFYCDTSVGIFLVVCFMLFSCFDSKAAYMKAFFFKIKPDQTTCVPCEGGCPSADPLFCSFTVLVRSRHPN